MRAVDLINWMIWYFGDDRHDKQISAMGFEGNRLWIRTEDGFFAATPPVLAESVSDSINRHSITIGEVCRDGSD